MKLLNWLIKLKGLSAHCDSCGYKEELKNLKTLVENGNLDVLLNKRCPKCGHIMINENDLNSLRRTLKLMDVDESGKSLPSFSWRTKPH